MPILRNRIVSVCLLLLLATGTQADFAVDLDSGDLLEVYEFGGEHDGPLFLWLVNQYGELVTPNALIETLASRGATVWRTDLLDSLLLQRSSEAIRSLDGGPVAALLDAAVDSGRGPIVLVTCDRMAVPLLRGLHEWRKRGGDSATVAGGILFFPNLYRGTPVAGEQPELLGIVDATNMPLAILQPALGANRDRLTEVLDALHDAGSPAYGWLVDQVRDYYLLYSEEPTNRALESSAGIMPPEVRSAIADTPNQLLMATQLLARTPRPDAVLPLDEAAEQPIAPAYGLIERQPRPAPDYDLVDARGSRHALDESLGRVTLVNFWATWCPPCVHEIPSMNRLAGAYDEDEFAIVSINFREEPEHILEFMREVDVDFPVLMDEDGAVSRDWGVFAFPSSFLLDRDGRIRYTVNTAIEWDTDEVREVIDRLRSEDRYTGLPHRPVAQGPAATIEGR
ncbi:TlpA family protein disulfide reductase [Thioalkalivibrio paradoxus]|uniref:Thiol-disulfide isomerase n=1 Tax=Thioalkalivibrio paradoxus ARh 1 TaxID=713585 RepID=W0DQB7_9GAMM|nr:TlpA disulfide reductase family protein [Thioalkalivibrio paradoxus]AHE99163.1 thiol-disulfide isomerase [Thioalkalivibrio paradoxus ARh 1]